jgi:hypothetical protein
MSSPEEFIDKELRDTVGTINSITKLCWDAYHSAGIAKDQLEWISLAKEVCALKFDILTNDSFLKTAREAARLTETEEEEEE